MLDSAFVKILRECKVWVTFSSKTFLGKWINITSENLIVNEVLHKNKKYVSNRLCIVGFQNREWLPRYKKTDFIKSTLATCFLFDTYQSPWYQTNHKSPLKWIDVSKHSWVINEHHSNFTQIFVWTKCLKCFSVRDFKEMQ